MNKKSITITEADIHNMVKMTLNKLQEGWDGDRFSYDNFTDEGNGGLEEYGTNIANLIKGLGSDPDSIHGLGEEVAQYLDNNTLKMFIEGLQSVYESGEHLTNPSPQDYYDKNNIHRN